MAEPGIVRVRGFGRVPLAVRGQLLGRAAVEYRPGSRISVSPVVQQRLLLACEHLAVQ